MKRVILFISVVAAFAACQKENAGQQIDNLGLAPAELYAVIEDEEPATKIHLGEYEGKYRVLWDGYNDATAVFAGIDKSSIYRVKGATANTPSATLYLQDGKEATSATTIGAIAAYYPYPSSGTVGGMQVTENGDGSYTFPGSFSDYQTYLEGSFPDRGFPLVAVSGGVDDYSLNFKNAAGILGLNVKGGSRIKSITLKSNESDKVICGNADITVSNTDVAGNVPSYEFTGGRQTLTLNCASAVQTSVDETTPFYLGVAPQTFPEGFTVTLNDEDGFSRTVVSAKKQIIERSKVLDMPALTFPFYENVEWSKFNLGTGNTTYDAASQTFTFTGSSNRWFDFPGLKGDITAHPVLRMWVTSSNVVLSINVRHDVDGDGTVTQTTAATLYGQTDKIISGRTLVELDLSAQSAITEDMLKNVTSIRISMKQAAASASEPYHISLDRIVLE